MHCLSFLKRKLFSGVTSSIYALHSVCRHSKTRLSKKSGWNNLTLFLKTKQKREQNPLLGKPMNTRGISLVTVYTSYLPHGYFLLHKTEQGISVGSIVANKVEIYQQKFKKVREILIQSWYHTILYIRCTFFAPKLNIKIRGASYTQVWIYCIFNEPWYQKKGPNLGVCLIHECILYTRQYSRYLPCDYW